MDLTGYEVVNTVTGRMMFYNSETRMVYLCMCTDKVEFMGKSIMAYDIPISHQRMMHLRELIRTKLVKHRLAKKNEEKVTIWRMVMLLPCYKDMDVLEAYKSYCHKLSYENNLANQVLAMDESNISKVKKFEETYSLKANRVVSAYRTSSTRARVYYVDDKGILTSMSVVTDKNTNDALKYMIDMYYLASYHDEIVDNYMGNIIGLGFDYVRCSDLVGKRIFDIEDELLERYMFSSKYVAAVFDAEYSKVLYRNHIKECFIGEIALKLRSIENKEVSNVIKKNIKYVQLIMKEQLIKAMMKSDTKLEIKDCKLERFNVAANLIENSTIIYMFTGISKHDTSEEEAIEESDEQLLLV